MRSIPLPPPVRLDPRKLETFLEATRHGSYTAAAARLHVTQSAVSHAIRKLEDEVGRRLVRWSGRRLVLTEDGEYLYQVCQGIFRDLRDAERVLTLPGRPVTQAVTLGATVEFGTTVLVRKLRPLLEGIPSLHVDFRFDDDLAGLLLRDEIDVAVDCRPHGHRSVEATPLFREKYVVVAARAFLAAHPVSRPKDLEGVPVLSIDKDGRWWANALRAMPAGARPGLSHVVQVDQVRGMVHAALEGYGVALLPKYAVLGKVARGELVTLFPTLPLLEDWFCVYQKRANAGLEKNRLLTACLRRLDVREFGDAIGGGPRRGRPGGPGLGLAAPPPGTERPERDRVAPRLDRRDVVLPLAARGARQDVRRPGRQGQLDLLAPLLASQQEAAGARQRDAHDDAEHRCVPVPADWGAGRVLHDESLDELRGGQAGERCAALPERLEERRDGRPFLDRRRFRAVAPAEVHNPAARRDAPHDELPELEALDLRQHRPLLVGRQELGLVDEPFGEARRVEETGLVRH